MKVEKTVLYSGQARCRARLTFGSQTIKFKFGFNRRIKDEIKNMKGSKWVPETKEWSVSLCDRNIFQLEFLEGLNPYAIYDKDLIPTTSTRPMREHQFAMKSHMYTRRQCIIAGEMGVGKTLAAIDLMCTAHTEGMRKWLYVAPAAVLGAIYLELRKWESHVIPDLVTYESMHKIDFDKYDGVIFDEASKIKNYTTKRAKNAAKLATKIRAKHGDKGYIILMTGTPAPHNPTDWWSLCEIACPGFLVEGTVQKLKNSLALIEYREGLGGSSYPHLLTWLNDENKCAICGQYEDAKDHHEAFDDEAMAPNPDYHKFKKSVDEVARLGRRMAGLVMVILKKDCLDLPEKVYKIIPCEPDASTLRAAKTIAAKATNTVTAYTLLRELSDGFQYKMTEVKGETVKCPACNGLGVVTEGRSPDPDLLDTLTDESGEMIELTAEEKLMFNIGNQEEMETEQVQCRKCLGKKVVPRMKREVLQVKSPKDAVLKEILEEKEETGRLVIFGGFTGTIDKIVRLVTEAGWDYIRVDGRGWTSSIGQSTQAELLKAFQEGQDIIPKLVYIAHPKAGGYGVTLTASDTIVYFSNVFDGEARMQSEDRIHRIGARGANIIDIFNLETDRKILDNLNNKVDLQSASMNDIREIFK